MIVFANPSYLFCLPIVAFFLLLYLLSLLYAEKRNQSPVTVRGSTPFLVVKSSLLFMALFFIFLALAHPEANPHFAESEVQLEEKAKRKTPPLYIVLDTSRSMTVNDCEGGESRFACAKKEILALLDTLPGQTVALYGADSVLTRLIPKTFDHLFFRLLLEGVSPDDEGRPGTDFVQMLSSLADESKDASPKPMILLLSDGGDTKYETAIEGAKVDRIKEIIDKAASLPPVWAIAFGTVQGGVIPELLYQGKAVHVKRLDDPLKAIVKDRFFLYGDSGMESKLKKAMQDLLQEAEELPKKEFEAKILYDDYTAWPLFISASCLLLFWALPSTSYLRLLPFMVVSMVQASQPMVNSLIETESCEELLPLLSEYTSESDWEKGAKKIDLALCYLKRGEAEMALGVLEPLNLEPQTDASLIERYRFLYALAVDDKWLSGRLLNLLNTPSSKEAKARLITKENEKKQGLLHSLALAIRGQKNVVLAEHTPELRRFFTDEQSLHDVDGKSHLASAFINFRQKDFAESLTFFQRAEKELLEEAKGMGPYEMYEALLQPLSPSLATIEAAEKVMFIQEEAKSFLLSGHFVLLRKALLLSLLQGLAAKEFEKPKERLPALTLQYEAILALFRLERFFGVETAVSAFLPDLEKGLHDFWKTVLSFQKNNYLKKGLCFSWDGVAERIFKAEGLHKTLVAKLEEGKKLPSLLIVKEIVRLLKEAKKELESRENQYAQNEEKRERRASESLQYIEQMDKELFSKKAQPPDGEKPW